MAPTDSKEDTKKDVVHSSTESPKRRVNKPMIERRRRERINECLNQLQSLISQLDKDKPKIGKSNKLEKADILEMTVDFVKRTQPKAQDDVAKLVSDGNVQYMAGYEKCKDEIHSFLKTTGNVPEDVRNSLLQHLQSCTKEKLQKSPDQKSLVLNEQSNKTSVHVPNTYPTIQPRLQTVNLSPPTVTSVNSNQSNRNVLICNQNAPTYVLVPTATLCQSIPISSQVNQTADSPLNLAKNSGPRDIQTNASSESSSVQLGPVNVNGSHFIVIPQGQLSNVQNITTPSVLGQPNLIPMSAIPNINHGNLLCLPNMQMTLPNSHSDEVWRPW